MPRTVADLTGQTFGRLTVTGRAPAKARKAQWACASTCGNVKTVSGYSLRAGKTVSCGCKRREQMATGPTHPRWLATTSLEAPGGPE